MSQCTYRGEKHGCSKCHKTIIENVTIINKKIPWLHSSPHIKGRGSLAFATFGESKVGFCVIIRLHLLVQSNLVHKVGEYLL
jgi:hypothetical protein